MSHNSNSRWKLPQALASLAGLILLLVWMEGGFHYKTPPGLALAASRASGDAGAGVAVEVSDQDDLRSWPATVSARSVTQIAAKLPARIREITVRAGDTVKAGQVLSRLDESEPQARLAQARAALAAAQAQATRNAADAHRTQNLFNQEAATRQMLETAQAAAQGSAAQVSAAQAGVQAAASLAGEAELRAPFDGAILERRLEPGDMAMPGQTLLILQSNQQLRVEAAIPESCAANLKPGQKLNVRIGAQDHRASLEEIAPAADAQTRTVFIKAALDPQAHTQPGAFAWLEQSCGQHRSLSIPADAVIRSGQLESVRLVVDGVARLRHIRTGKSRDGRVEVLSGLKEGDRILSGGAR